MGRLIYARGESLSVTCGIFYSTNLLTSFTTLNSRIASVKKRDGTWWSIDPRALTRVISKVINYEFPFIALHIKCIWSLNLSRVETHRVLSLSVEAVVLVSIWTTSSALNRGQKVVHRGLVSAAVCGGEEKVIALSQNQWKEDSRLKWMATWQNSPITNMYRLPCVTKTKSQ